MPCGGTGGGGGHCDICPFLLLGGSMCCCSWSCVCLCPWSWSSSCPELHDSFQHYRKKETHFKKLVASKNIFNHTQLLQLHTRKYSDGSFLLPPTPHHQFFWKISENFIENPWIPTINFQFWLISSVKIWNWNFSLWSDSILIRKLTASYFESQKTVNTIKVTVKMREMFFSSIPIDVMKESLSFD